MVVLTSAWRYLPHGLMIRTLRPGVEIPRSPGVQPLLIQVDAAGIFIDSERMSLDSLSARLKQELSRRPPEWPVYIQGDADLAWRKVAEVIDAVRGQGAEVVLITPGTH
jgi:biopolymer transport protein ExbD